MKHLIFLFLFILGAVIAASAQSTYTSRSFGPDTLTNAANDTITLPFVLKDENAFGWQITATQLSGTTAGVARVQYSLDGSNWATSATDTVAIAAGTKFFTGNSFAPRMRLVIFQSGTSSTKYNVVAVLRKRLF